MRKLYIVVLAIAVIIVAGYEYLRIILKPESHLRGVVHADQPIAKTPKSFLDLRPRLIARLQEIVKKGSNGLYNLSIGSIKPDLLKLRVQVLNARLVPDVNALSDLDNGKKAPDDVFDIFSPSLQIDGIGLEELLNKDVIDLKTILINDPVIKVSHQKRIYNQNTSEASTSLYQKLMGQLKKISVAEIKIKNGTLVLQNKNAKAPVNFKNVTVHMKNLLIDSTTQFNKDRFLFARFAEINFKNFRLPTKDNLYWLNAGSVSISANSKKLAATNVSLKPRGTKKEFQKKLKHRQVMYDMAIPILQLDAINWWNLFNGDGLQAEEINISNAKCTVYLDRTLQPANEPPNNFPHQLLYSLDVPVQVNRLNLKRSAIVYREYNPLSKNTGTVYLSSVNARVTNLTNKQDAINQNNKTTLTATAVFMHKAELKTRFQFNLSKIKTGAFTAKVEIGALDNEVLNPIAEPMGLFQIKSGSLQKATASIQGDNYNASGKVLVLYRDLHVTPLKPAGTDTTEIRKKHLVSFFANTFIVKDENPSKGEEPRRPDASFTRLVGRDLFNLVWKTMLVGTLKTIGVNPKYATPRL
jgi:hypothetical protein